MNLIITFVLVNENFRVHKYVDYYTHNYDDDKWKVRLWRCESINCWIFSRKNVKVYCLSTWQIDNNKLRDVAESCYPNIKEVTPEVVLK